MVSGPRPMEWLTLASITAPRLARLAAVALLALGLGGCPNDSDDDPTDTGRSDTAQDQGGDTTDDQGGGGDTTEDSGGTDLAEDSGGLDGAEDGGDDASVDSGDGGGGEDADDDGGGDGGGGEDLAGDGGAGDGGFDAADFGDLGVADGGDADGGETSEPLPTCEIRFDSTCPDDAPECGADFSGSPGCRVAGLGNCYESGSRGYEVTTAEVLTITFAGDVNDLELFLAFQNAGHAGTMRFLDADGEQVGSTLTANGPCNAATMPANHVLSFDEPVRSAVVTATTGTLWLDSMNINP